MERGFLDHNSAECSSIALSMTKVGTPSSKEGRHVRHNQSSVCFQMCVLTIGFTAL